MARMGFILIYCFFSINPVRAQMKIDLPRGINFYLVRHAEKDTGNDPVLNKRGYERAGDLYRVLKNKKIDHIYFTQYRRTKLTGDSLRIYQKIDTSSYKADTTGNGFLESLQLYLNSVNAPKNILVIGHTNTIPAIIKKLGADPGINEIPDNEYDNLFIVHIRKNKTYLKRLKYGKASPVIAPGIMKP
jgi:2,3-bisphosphoglycerate-dependent phosphoglycerate mutase